ncbi:hypothetical protein HanRHA438_Chr15g0709911 [Helianthus annuus]|uniref:Uncharacterized protein n=1 Tax=Helianthus annuus TaxID=4232 RepID=A0A9K3E156_HELAN|nr:hypothetical protein HanXRQr2_Chr15g0697701 [Helianthus annuus]KAJ0845112.1 hypothetical protein HanRHA438_Chr15g0709911 [Helianthus annuus]
MSGDARRFFPMAPMTVQYVRQGVRLSFVSVSKSLVFMLIKKNQRRNCRFQKKGIKV